MNYSVLMSVYYKEKPEYLRQSMDSIFAQSIPTDEFVLVCDGPLNDELDNVIDEMVAAHSDVLKVVRLEKNVGLGNALNQGIKHCRNDLVARMDSDDIARPDRCERQLAVFEERSEIGMVSGIVEEFTTDPNIIDVRRVPPEQHEDILKFAKKRNPFNHPWSIRRKQPEDWHITSIYAFVLLFAINFLDEAGIIISATFLFAFISFPKLKVDVTGIRECHRGVYCYRFCGIVS